MTKKTSHPVKHPVKAPKASRPPSFAKGPSMPRVLRHPVRGSK